MERILRCSLNMNPACDDGVYTFLAVNPQPLKLAFYSILRTELFCAFFLFPRKEERKMYQVAFWIICWLILFFSMGATLAVSMILGNVQTSVIVDKMQEHDLHDVS